MEESPDDRFEGLDRLDPLLDGKLSRWRGNQTFIMGIDLEFHTSRARILMPTHS
jgi:hypothetical protein